MPLHKATSTAAPPRPRRSSGAVKPPKKAEADGSAKSAGHRPARKKKKKHVVAPPRQDDYVIIRIGDHSTYMSTGVIQKYNSALKDTYERYYASNTRGPHGLIELRLNGSPEKFSAIENFFVHGSLPPDLTAQELDWYKQTAQQLRMPKLYHEADEIYPLGAKLVNRQCSSPDQTCTLITDMLMYAAALVRHDENRPELIEQLENMLRLAPVPNDAALAGAAMLEPDVRRSGLTFAALALRRMNLTKRLCLFKVIAAREPLHLFSHSDMGELLRRYGLNDACHLFLDKMDQFIPKEDINNRCQRIRVEHADALPTPQYAITWLENAPNLHREPSALITLGRAQLSCGAWADARATLNQALTLDVPDELMSALHMGLGQCYQSTGDTGQMFEHFNAAYDYAPYNIALNFLLGQALHDAHQYDEAYQVRHELTMMEPRLASGYRWVAETQIARGELNDAWARLMIADTLDPEDVETLTLRVQLAERMGRWREAITTQQRLIPFFFSDARVWRNLAHLYEQNGEHNSALGARRCAFRFEEAAAEMLPTSTLSPMQSPKRNSSASSSTSRSASPFPRSTFSEQGLPLFDPAIIQSTYASPHNGPPQMPPATSPITDSSDSSNSSW